MNPVYTVYCVSGTDCIRMENFPYEDMAIRLADLFATAGFRSWVYREAGSFGSKFLRF